MNTNQNKSQNHIYFMRLALQQAQKILGNTKDNPAVGCIIAKNKHVIAAGATSINGRPHAEHNAINFSKVKLKNSQISRKTVDVAERTIRSPENQSTTSCTVIVVVPAAEPVFDRYF